MINTGLPKAAAKCAVVLLTVTITSQACIRAASPSMSLKLSISVTRFSSSPWRQKLFLLFARVAVL